MAVKFFYMYRDASNYKELGEVIFEGEIADGDWETLQDAANEDGEHFVASQVGLEPLQPRLASFPSPDDHGSSELPYPPEATEEGGMTDPRDWRDFVAEFTAMKGKWDPVAECELLGIDILAQWGDSNGSDDGESGGDGDE